MKPLRLTMTAFGPYKDTESIDFSELEENNLFVISGNTGAGKTTIFDGICFALYGSASGSDRGDYNMLRSDFAEDHIHTSVELEFELNGKTYRIMRQLGHLKKGNKTKTGDRCEFFEKVDGREIPCVDRQMVREIDQKVEVIIGLTKDQFKQIVMLPQGEFRKLLTSETENKEAILRKIFKTDSYKQMNELLRERKNQAENTYKEKEYMLERHVSDIISVLPRREESSLFGVLAEEHHNVHQILAGLEKEKAFYQDKIQNDQEASDKAFQERERKQKELHQAETVNEQFQQLDQKEKQLREQKEKIPAVEEKEKQVTAAERASGLLAYENQVNDRRREETEKKHVLTNEETAKKQADQQYRTAETTYQQEESKKGKRETVSKKLDQLHELFPAVQEMDEEKKRLAALKDNRDKSNSKWEQAKAALEKKRAQLEKAEEKVNVLERNVSQLPDKQQELTHVHQQVKVLAGFLEKQMQQNALDKDLQRKKAAYLQIKSKYDQMNEAWLSNQASLLAAHLHDGEACPVCGSVEHPDKAETHEGAVSKEQLELLKRKLDETEKLYRDSDVKKSSNTSQLMEKEQELKTYEIAAEKAAETKPHLEQREKQLDEEVQTLKQQQESLKKGREFLVKTKQEIKQLESDNEELEKNFRVQDTDYQKSLAIYRDRLGKIPEEIRVLAELEKQMKETKAQQTQLEEAWEKAQSGLQQAKEQLTRADSNHTHAGKQLEEAREKRKKAEEQFKTAYSDAGFESEETYQQAKMPSTEREQLKTNIQQFKDDLTALKQATADLKKSLQDKKRVDLAAIQAELDQLKERYEKAFNTLNQSKNFHKEIEKFQLNIQAADEQVKQQERKMAAIADLYDVIRGQNSQKISFERYLQIEYLEQIIEAANGRLKHLSNGQFNLMRSDRQESHGRQSGLGLDVYDAYTGQTRDVKSLSGGEKFNASLCLALGMSDVIQSFQGNISIQTMFIDEGFGSLDEESLHKSIDTLIDLQQGGRMIGVISHVQELKSMFPATLQVAKTKEGHSETRFVVS
ncbi:AAA family ATPase [Lentibacillus sediminis]|uniref:AAA family ATPase n=1 Tax=Lentibacillus sediminis TaxID=1940529 RepID=UPI000C1BF38B|nr:SMC family ATPase [Lentibacillus sediminis]